MSDSENDGNRFTFLSGDQLIDEIFALVSNDDAKRTTLLKGKSGTGKTFIGNKIADRWNSEKTENIALYIRGELAYSQRNCYPFISCLQFFKAQKEISEYFPDSIKELSRGIPMAGDFIAYILEQYSKNKKVDRDSSLRFLNETEKVLLYDIEMLFRNKRVLLIIDNIQYLDIQSLQFIDILLQDNLVYNSAVAKQIKYLLIYTEDQEIAAPAAFKIIISKPHTGIFALHHIDKSAYVKALRSLGYNRNLEPSILNEIYLLTGGNLILIKRLSEYLADDQHNLAELLKISGAGNTEAKFTERLLLDKLTILGATGDQIISMLEFASIIGVSFTQNEILCISQRSEQELKELIQKAKDIDLINETTAGQQFSHEVIRFFFLNRIGTNRGSYCQTFANCLAKIRPSDYFTRANYLFEAGRLQEAIILYIIGVLQNCRSGLTTNPVLINRINAFTGDFEFGDFLNRMSNGYAFFYKGEYTNAIQVIEGLENWYPTELLAEKNFLNALCRIKSIKEADKQIAKECLNGWGELKAREPELWARINTTLLTVYANEYDYVSAKKLEKEIVSALAERVSFDDNALFNLNTIRRSAAALHINDIAVIRTRQSVDYFTTITEKKGLLYPIPLYLAYTNHSANLLTAGNFEDAFDFAGRASLLMKNYQMLLFPEPQICLSNYIVAGYLSGRLQAEECSSIFEQLNQYEDMIADELLIKNNNALICMANGQPDIALTIINNALKQISAKQIDQYYYYYLKANQLSLQHVLTKKMSFKKEWQKLEKFIPDIPDKQYLLERHHLLENSFELPFDTWEEWNNQTSLKETPHIGKSWLFFGRGFLFTDIQLWHES